MVLTALAIFAVGGAIGGAVGFKVEQRRVKDELASKRALERAETEKLLNFELKNVRPVGRITEVRDRAFRMTLLSTTGHRDLELTDLTLYRTAIPATDAVLEPGATVLVNVRGNAVGELRAREVIVLPEGTTFGRRG